MTITNADGTEREYTYEVGGPDDPDINPAAAAKMGLPPPATSAS
eukprot:CAMPEP_0175482112 /NCGR_PEP_ID=MMETSP0095-20121207/78792_1 /TAXON_ID=311494 /ORGANISM="Alexandrium monilatum, Strain CCMP3105" /LENGTH=43 /DNA_ID= /DNA_START= /DNA_END= /DNA_ORIENTATION=